MTFPEWSVLFGFVLTIGLAIAPWMVKVHAKLAVIASQIVELGSKLDRSYDESRQLWAAYSNHQSRLDTQEIQLVHIAERLRRE